MSQAKAHISAPVAAARWRVRAGRCARMLLALWLVAAALFYGAVYLLPYPAAWRQPYPPGTCVVDSEGQTLVALVNPHDQWHFPVGSEQLSPWLKQAIVAVEDRRFYQHHGVDWQAVAAGMWQNAAGGAIRRGASTLTMQLQRLRDPRSRSWLSKLDQAIRAQQIELTMDKNAIVSEYLNRAPFGGNLVGAQAAALRYFGKPCSRLSLAQAALLAGLPQSPARLRPDRHPAAALARRHHVLECMVQCGMIDQAQMLEADREPLDAVWRNAPQMALEPGALPPLLDWAQRYRGFNVRLSLQSSLQNQCAAALRQACAALGRNVEGAVVLLDNSDGRVLAAAVNNAAQHAPRNWLAARRSTGSLLKPFIYGQAFANGLCGPQSIVQDAPQKWNDYAPGNFDQQFLGELTASEALAASRNLPALRLLASVGLEANVAFLRRCGLESLESGQRYGLSLAVGGAEATIMEIASAYAMLGRQGMGCRLIDVLRVNSAAPVYAAGGTRLLETQVARQVIAALSQPQRLEAICPTLGKRQFAWKTGTSSAQRDAWAAAFSLHYTLVVWMGIERGAGDAQLIGAYAAAPAALRLLDAIDRDMATFPLPREQAVLTAPPGRRAPALVCPTEGEVFVLVRSRPLAEQRITLEAQAAGPLWWFVDGQLLEKRERPGPLLLEPSPGDHQVTVVDELGHAASARFRVVSAPAEFTSSAQPFP